MVGFSMVMLVFRNVIFLCSFGVTNSESYNSLSGKKKSRRDRMVRNGKLGEMTKMKNPG